MKSYTDLEQSKKLSEILPLESADMWFANGIYLMKTSEEPKDIKGVFPCWSLAALLDVISYPTLSQEYDSKWYCREYQEGEEVEGCETSVDACYEMIIKLHEQKLL